MVYQTEMITVNSIKDITNTLEEIVSIKNAGIVSVDGVDGSGKSYLACELSKSSKYAYFDIDGSYLIPNNGKFIEFINYKKLKSDINYFLASGHVVVIDCICSTLILKKIDLIADVKIYVKKTIVGEWRDGKLLNYSRNVEDVLAEKRKISQELEYDEANIGGREPEIFNFSEENMKDEILRYHFEYQPENNADIIFEREKAI
jgi:hypothetical protein